MRSSLRTQECSKEATREKHLGRQFERGITKTKEAERKLSKIRPIDSHGRNMTDKAPAKFDRDSL